MILCDIIDWCEIEILNRHLFINVEISKTKSFRFLSWIHYYYFLYCSFQILYLYYACNISFHIYIIITALFIVITVRESFRIIEVSWIYVSTVWNHFPKYEKSFHEIVKCIHRPLSKCTSTQSIITKSYLKLHFHIQTQCSKVANEYLYTNLFQ